MMDDISISYILAINFCEIRAQCMYTLFLSRTWVLVAAFEHV
jgi:hypothetical protein